MKNSPVNIVRAGMRPNTHSRLFLAAVFVLSLLLAGCSMSGEQTSGEPTATAISSQAPADTPVTQQPTTIASDASAGTQVVIPGMPACSAGGTSTDASEVVADPAVQASTTVTPFVIYCGGKLADRWSDASWQTTFDMQSNDFPHQGHPTIKAQNTDGWSAFSVADWNTANSPDGTKYTHFHFWINGGKDGGQQLGISMGDTRLPITKYLKSGKIEANKWQEVFVPLADLQADGLTINRITIQDVSGKVQPAYYLDGLEFFKDNTPDPTPVVAQPIISIDFGKNRQPISPYIYGMSQAPQDIAKDANITLNRLGGNPYSTYNWTLGNARNAGSDWEFRNYSRETDPAYKLPSGLADMFFKGNKSFGADSLLTVPTLGYVARNDDNNTMSQNVPSEGGGPVSSGSEAIQGYDPKEEPGIGCCALRAAQERSLPGSARQERSRRLPGRVDKPPRQNLRQRFKWRSEVLRDGQRA